MPIVGSIKKRGQFRMNILSVFAAAGSALVLTQSSLTEAPRSWLDAAAKRASETRERHLLTPYDGIFVAIPVTGARLWLFAKPLALLSKLVSCPMCSGFWLGLAWAFALSERSASLVAHGFVASLASALLVALWIALGETQAALGLWRFLNPPPEHEEEKPTPDGCCEDRVQCAINGGHGHPMTVVCPRHLVPGGERCPL